ncbi:MAG TPA: pirin family protein [Gammaproteobacteria bacterium]|nr:pirin family protein [Gammaproteobacteria bacterium]
MSNHEKYQSSNADATGLQLIDPEVKELGGFSVRRLLPADACNMVGPFIFFDHFGPTEFPPGEGVQVRPHPHIGLSTVTYLFEGEIIHRDSLGYVQAIQAGAVNLMTAGRGIVHSERAGDDLDRVSRLHGLQVWMALPLAQEECAPDFTHYPASELPGFDRDGVAIRVIIGAAFGHESPVTQYAPTLYLECKFPAATMLALPNSHDEIAAYVVSGEMGIGESIVTAGRMAVAPAGETLRLQAARDSHVIIIGGARFGERHIWWNYVSSSRQRIEQAKQDWRNKRFDEVPGENEFIPLPD